MLATVHSAKRASSRKPGRAPKGAAAPGAVDSGAMPAHTVPASPGAVADDRIFETIHDAVLDQRLPPGTKLKEVALAELFGTTRAVIRKALVRLAHIKVVVIRPNRGAEVASPTIEESRDLFAARGAIECAIVESLAGRITKEQLRELRSIIRLEQDAYRRGELRTGLKLSVEFHRVLADMAGNRVLAEFLDQLVARTPLVVLAHKGPVEQSACSIDEHSAILDAMAAGDSARAVALMRQHLDSLLRKLDLEGAARHEADLAELLGLRRA